MSADILNTIADHTRVRIAAQRQDCPLEKMIQQAEKLAQAELDQSKDGKFAFPFEANLARPELSFICEVKKASPSKGVIAEDFPYLEIASEYEQAGADAISCLTEPKWFLGSDSYVEEITSHVDIPVLRKDFTIDEYMIYQAKVLRSSAVLLIAAILDDAQLERYGKIAADLGLSALYEAHDAEEIKRSLDAGAKILGVNNRNLKDFSVDLNNVRALEDLIPKDVIYVAESGVSSAEDVRKIASTGRVDAILVGEALMRSSNKAQTLSSFREAASTVAQEA